MNTHISLGLLTLTLENCTQVHLLMVEFSQYYNSIIMEAYQIYMSLFLLLRRVDEPTTKLFPREQITYSNR